MSKKQNNTDAFSWKRGKEKSRKSKKVPLASQPSFFFLYNFLLQRWFEESIYSICLTIYNNVVGTKFQN